MKRSAILTVLLTLLVTSAFAQRPPTLTDDDIESPKPKAEEKGKPIPAGVSTATTNSAWEEFSSQEGGFTAKWPGKPTEKSQQVETDSGQLDQKMFALEKNGIGYGVIYSQEVVEYPAACCGSDSSFSLRYPVSLLRGSLFFLLEKRRSHPN